MDVDDAIDELYRTPPDEFVAAREAVVAELKRSGERQAARQVHGLRRPSVVVWAVNQVARDDPDAVAALVGATERLATAQTTGRDSDALRAAGRDRRDVLTRLAGAANSRLGEVGTRTDKSDEIAALLDAASLDPEAAEGLASGRLTAAPARPSGFEAIFGGDAPAAPDADRGAPGRETEQHEEEHDAQVAEARAVAERAVTAARDRFDERTRATDRAAEEVRRLEGELERARAHARAAADDTAAARQGLAEAEEALNRTFE